MFNKFWFSLFFIFLVFLDAPTALGVAVQTPNYKNLGISRVCVIAVLEGGGYYKGNIKPAVWRFQKANKIKSTGKIDQKTEKALKKLAKNHPKACADVIKKQNKASSPPLNPDPLSDVESGLPDLVITNFSLNPRFPAEGEEVKLEVEIRNIGSSTAKNIEYGYSILQGGSIDYQVLLACEDILSLKPQESCISRTNLKFKSSGLNLVILKVDPETKIQESNEDNNNFGMLGAQVYDSASGHGAIKVFPLESSLAAKSAQPGQKNVEFLKFKIANKLDKDIKILSLNLVLLGSAKPADIDAIHWYDDKRELGAAIFTDYGTGQNFASINSDDPPGCGVPKECKEMFVVEADKEKVITITADISNNATAPSYAVFAMMESFYVVLGDRLTVTGAYPITGGTVLIGR